MNTAILSAKNQKAGKPEPRNITADGIVMGCIETEETEDLTDNSKKAIVGVIFNLRSRETGRYSRNCLGFIQVSQNDDATEQMICFSIGNTIEQGESLYVS